MDMAWKYQNIGSKIWFGFYHCSFIVWSFHKQGKLFWLHYPFYKERSLIIYDSILQRICTDYNLANTLDLHHKQHTVHWYKECILDMFYCIQYTLAPQKLKKIPHHRSSILINHNYCNAQKFLNNLGTSRLFLDIQFHINIPD